MTLVRGLALKISNAVVRYAAPGCKEWAEGLAGEVPFIEGDWAALGWALGSTRVLFDRREATIGSLADVPAAAQKFVETTRNRFKGLGMWLPILRWPQFGWMFFFTKSGSGRAGCALVVLGSIIAGVYLLIGRRRLKQRPSYDIYLDVVACAQFYRAELERAYSRLWIPCSAALCCCVGATLALRGEVRVHPGWDAAWGLLWVCAALLFLHMRRINRRWLEQLESLLAERSRAL